MTSSDPERLRRWRLMLGKEPAACLEVELGSDGDRMDAALAALYDADDAEDPDRESGPRGRGGLGASSPNVARWLGDIRKYFPVEVVKVMQKDAIERLDLKQLLMEPEILSQAEADIHLVSTLVSLNRMIPEKSRETARSVVRRLVRELLRKLEQPTRQAVSGALSRSLRNRRPRLREIDWLRTIRANLHNYLPEHRAIVPEQLVGYGRRRSSLKEVVLCIDQSGSMASSVIYSSIFGAVMASMPALSTRFVAFDTAVVDLSENLRDPVDLLFGVQLGGGTDIHRALVYCEQRLSRPADTVMVLISDLEEGGSVAGMLQAAERIRKSGVQLIALLSLSDEGKPRYDHRNAAALAALDIPVFACTPDRFPDLMAAALAKRDLTLWLEAGGAS